MHIILPYGAHRKTIITNGFDTTKNMKGKVAHSATCQACKLYFTVVIFDPNPWHFDTDPDPDPYLHWFTDPDPEFCGSGFQDANKNYFFRSLSLVCLLLTIGSLTSVFKDNMSLRSHKRVDTWFILIFLLANGRIQILEAQKHSDPDHWL